LTSDPNRDEGRERSPSSRGPGAGASSASAVPSGIPERDELTGEVLDGKYLIEGIIARAPTGTVYRGKNVTIGSEVAVKILPRHMQHDADQVARFEREARVCSALNHPNCVAVLDHGRDADGRLYTVMEYVEGRPLRALIKKFAPMPIPRIVRILTQVLAALGEGHANGIVHGALTPDNIIVTDRPADPDFLQVLDFGRNQAGAPEARRIAGQPAYMSPEQARGEAFDERTDIYAVGVILYEMLCGEVPFDAETPSAIAAQHAQQSVVPPSQRVRGTTIEPDIEALCLRCLSKDPSERPGDADGLAHMMRELTLGEGGVDALTGHVSTIPDAVEWPEDRSSPSNPAVDTSATVPDMPATTGGKRKLWLVVAVVVGIAAVGAGLAVALGSGSSDDEEAHAATPADESNDGNENDGDPAEAVPSDTPAGVGDENELVAPAGETAEAMNFAEPEDEAGERSDDETGEGDGETSAEGDTGEDGSSEEGEQEDDEETSSAREEDDDEEEERSRKSRRDRRRKNKSKKERSRRERSVVNTMLLQAKRYMSDGNKAGALRLVNRVLEREPDNAEAKQLKRKIDAH